MLTRNCVQRLLKPDDFNARVTIFNKNPKYFLPLAYKNAWLETICYSLGKGIMNSSDSNFITITSANGDYYNGFFTGKQLIDKLRFSFYEPVSVRISFPGRPTRSWIIVLEKDLNSQKD